MSDTLSKFPATEKQKEFIFEILHQEESPYLEYHIGKMYQYGLGTEADLERAASWFTKAVDKGYQYAQYTLGIQDTEIEYS